MRYIYVILTVLILSSVCNAESSPNTTPAATSPASPNTPAVIQPTPPPTIIQPTASHSDETIRIERDAYKQVVEAHQKTLATIEWAIGIIGSLIIILVGYIVFKNNKEYKDALEQAKEARNDAKEACKDARHWEAEAKQILGSIDKQVKAELETIKEQGKVSIREITAQTQTDMRVSELWSDALKLSNEGKYEEACEKYVEIVKLKSEDYWAYNNWGIALGKLVKLKENEKLFKDACDKFAKAVEINPDEHGAYNNWGTVLASWARITGNAELFKEASRKYAKAVEIKPDSHEAQKNWSSTLVGWAKLKIGKPEYESLLSQAEEKALKAESLKPGAGAYNLACIYALRGIKEECKKWLLTVQEVGTLVTREHAMNDSDLDSVRNEAWFKAIKWKGEK